MNSLSNLHKNCILTAPLGNHCLVCDCNLSDDESFAHTVKTSHQNNLVAAGVVEECRGEGIVKVKQCYYCIVCNTVLNNIDIVLHIKHENHIFKKAAQMLCKTNGIILAFEEVEVQENAWHGLIENTCVICKTNFDTLEEHKKGERHIWECVNNKCLLGDNFIYREIDDNSFFCVICATVYGGNEKAGHHISDEHTNNYTRGKEHAKISLRNAYNQGRNNALTNMVEILPYKTQQELSENLKKKSELSLHLSNNTERQNYYYNLLNSSANKLNMNSKCLLTDADPFKTHHYLFANEFIIQEGPEAWCILCDTIVNDVQSHITKDDHHQAILKEHQTYLFKKLDVTNIPKIEEYIDDDNKGTKNTEYHTPETDPKLPVTSECTKITDDVKKENHDQTSNEYSEAELKPTLKVHTLIEEDKMRSKMLEKVDEYQENDIIVDFTSATAYCKRCDENLKFSYFYLDKHIKEYHLVIEKLPSEQDLKANLELFAYENEFKLLENCANCTYCNVDVGLNLKEMDEHCVFDFHRDKVIAETGLQPLNKIKAVDYMDTFLRVDIPGEKPPLKSKLIINNSFVVSLKSFHTVVELYRTMHCAICRQNLWQRTPDVFKQHIATPEHTARLATCNVVISMENELIRELRPGVYHCAYCNAAFSSWERLAAHGRTMVHSTARRHSLWMLERSRASIANARRQQIINNETGEDALVRW